MAKILLVEDDNNLREIYEARLQAEGYDIVSAVDGEEALVVAKKEKPDLIISDVMMPRISGFEMLDILRNTDGLKDVKIIMLTALGQAEDKTRADSLGADRYLVKSQVTLEDIVRSAQELLGEAAAGTPTAPAPAPATSSPASPVVTALQPAAPTISTPTPVASPIPVTTPPAPSPVTAAAPSAPAVTPAPAVQTPAAAAASAPQPAQQPATPTPSASNTQPTPPGPKPAEEPPAGVPTPTTPPQPPVTTPPAPAPAPLPQTSPSQVQVLDSKPTPSEVSASPTAAASTSPPAAPVATAPPVPATPAADEKLPPSMPTAPVEAPKPPAPRPTSEPKSPPTPEPPQQAPAAPSPTASHTNTPEAQTTSEEEAAVKSQIEEFINQNNDQATSTPKQAEDIASTPSAPETPKAVAPSTASPAPANDNKQSQAIMADAIRNLVSETNPPTPSATGPAPTTIAPTQPVAPATPAQVPAASNDDSVTVAHKKIISPISQPTEHVPNLDELLAKEGSTLDDTEHVAAAAQSIVSPAATQTASVPSAATTGPASYTQLPTTPHPPGHVISPSAAPGGIDPNSIAL